MNNHPGKNCRLDLSDNNQVPKHITLYCTYEPAHRIDLTAVTVNPWTALATLRPCLVGDALALLSIHEMEEDGEDQRFLEGKRGFHER